VLLLGKLPEPWWTACAERFTLCHEDGRPIDPLRANTTSIIRRLRDVPVGVRKTNKPYEDGDMLERPDAELAKENIVLLAVLLEKILRYYPEKRITMDDSVEHPSFTYQ
jgi:serine/threonine-protein kinase SRPK3